MTDPMTAHLNAHATLFETIDTLTENGKLRRLAGAFARFVATLGHTPPPLLLACLLLSELEGRGHSCLVLADLAGDPSPQVGWLDGEWAALRAAAAQGGGSLPRNVNGWRNALQGCEQVWPVGDLDFNQPLVLDGERLYLRRYWRDESTVAASVRSRALALAGPDGEVDTGGIRAWLDRLFPHAAREGGPDWQKIACAAALRGQLAVITGGPGTGKTYTVARLLALLFATAGEAAPALRIALAAPTGKAAARLKQSIDMALDELAGKLGSDLALRDLAARMGGARTLHSLLGARPDTRSFAHHAGNPLEVDVLIVDEASMVHLEMMAALLAALPSHARLVLLGDKDQLASVEAGAVLGDLCAQAESGNYDAATCDYVLAATGETIPPAFRERDGGPLAQRIVMLRQSRRFGGPIGKLANAVNQGDADAAREVLRAESDGRLRWIEGARPGDVLALAVAGRPGAGAGYRDYLERVREGPGGDYEGWVNDVLKRFEQFRLLCAVREGEWGVAGLNEAIEAKLETAKLIRRRGEWYVGRPVMVTRNDYATGVYNGDIGLTLPDPLRPDSLRVWFSDGEAVRSVLATRLRNVETAFAMTVHKSQGSEFLHTAMVLPPQANAVLARELVYTGITRAREFFTLVSPNAAVFDQAIAGRTQRASGLRQALGT
ncbi:exodeoxyribonuclease V subunit alpha [Pseudoduganella albidiflava]|uniref:RecBCD enzyme subunit RecD n=1 Tax=Pseudoduganella albidiflava TaxID=321983 RepID=A0A411WWA2_9BURK|nr:exodeoxyribonuclease V subunit alpha [Pseudoduganella albidiflava]QBI01035.1 exodeoxyribonuclease V subunit alpha [Pseudoduganella albidiflava]GGY47593.1 RecBCD enzyme subunit RecD [Pseudoduganella albidiflava]